MAQNQDESTNDTFHPSIAVVLCLRGMDPSLSECLRGLAEQSSADFQLFCVVDDANDPALTAVGAAKSSFKNTPITLTIDQLSPSCSLKCSALITAFQYIIDQGSPYDVIALIDADTCCDRHWLKDLVAPMANPAIDATSGTRWFEPRDNGVGSWVRQIWNAAAIVQMELYGIPWGGALAFRTSLLEQTDFLQRLDHAFCEDTLLSQVLKQNGRTLHSVRKLVVTNSESTSLSAASRFINRQLLTTRLYHWSWPLVMLHATSIFLINFLTLSGTLIAICNAKWLLVVVFLSIFIAGQLTNAILLHWIGKINLRKIIKRDDPGTTVGLNHAPLLPYLLAVLASPWVHAWATLCTIFCSRIQWRGIEYRITSNEVEMLEYKTYKPLRATDQSID